MCGQNELIRKTAAQSLLNIGSVGLMVCPAVVIDDNHGNITLAHVDANTDITFIEEEINHIQRTNGNATCKITIYRNNFMGRLTPVKTEEILELEKYLTNKKVEFQTQCIEHDTLIIHEDGSFTSINQEDLSRFIQGVNGLKFEFANIAELQRDTYELQLASGFSPTKRKPLLVFDAGRFTGLKNQPLRKEFVDYIFQPDSEKSHNIKDFYLLINQKPISTDELDSLMHVIPRYKTLILSLAGKYKTAGNEYYKNKNYVAAISCYKDALKLNQKFKEAFHNIGMCHFMLEKYDEAIVYFDQALAIDPKYQNAIKNKEKTQSALKQSSSISEEKNPSSPG